MKQIRQLGALAAFIALAGCAISIETSSAPQPLKSIDAATFYTGRWYEMARTPMSFTDGCVAGTTDFFHRPDGQLIERDACRRGSPAGAEKIFEGPVTVLDPGTNDKINVHYRLYGFVPVSETYWMLDHGADYSWFIVSDPGFDSVDILDRSPRPSAATIRDLTARVRALGYDPAKLEFPERWPPGQG